MFYKNSQIFNDTKSIENLKSDISVRSLFRNKTELNVFRGANLPDEV